MFKMIPGFQISYLFPKKVKQNNKQNRFPISKHNNLDRGTLITKTSCTTIRKSPNIYFFFQHKTLLFIMSSLPPSGFPSTPPWGPTSLLELSLPHLHNLFEEGRLSAQASVTRDSQLGGTSFPNLMRIETNKQTKHPRGLLPSSGGVFLPLY